MKLKMNVQVQHIDSFYHIGKRHWFSWQSAYPAWKKSCGNTRLSAHAPTAFLILLDFHSCFYNSKETRYMFSIRYCQAGCEVNFLSMLHTMTQITIGSITQLPVLTLHPFWLSSDDLHVCMFVVISVFGLFKRREQACF